MNDLFVRNLLLGFLMVAWWSPGEACRGQSDQTAASDRPDRLRAELDQSFVQDFQVILLDCQTNHLEREYQLSLRLFIERDPGRLYIFFPSEEADRWERAVYANCQEEWRHRMRQLTSNYADNLFELAKRCADQGRGADAYQLLHEVLYWNPSHAEARRVLGHRRAENGWQVVSERMRKQRATRPHAQLPWPAGSYWQVETDHFEIVSAADEATTMKLAEQLQRCLLVWRQTFFEYWGNAGMLQNWWDGSSRFSPPSKRHKIVLFANRDDYLTSLVPAVPGIEASTGYYHDRLQTSFFYASDDPVIQETWWHELTHQLFQETIRARTGAFDQHSLWLGEGIAMYMESLRDFGEFAVLGGWDSRRLQFARMRRLRLNQHLPLSDMASMTREQFQRHPDVGQLYSQAAGLCHYLMNGEQGQLRPATMELLSAIYRGRLEPAKVEKILGRSFEEIDAGYLRFLPPSATQVSQLMLCADQLTELSLADAQLDEAAWQSLARCQRLKWLDLSGQQLTDESIQVVRQLPELEQLFANRCHIPAPVIGFLSQLPNLRLIDVSDAAMDNAARVALQAWKANNGRMTILGDSRQ